MVMIAAVVTPNLVGYLDRTRVERAITALEDIRNAVIQFRGHVGRYPRFLTYLTQTQALATSDLNSCNAQFGSGSGVTVNNWAGPYLSRIIPAGGLPIFIGTAQNQLVRTPASGSQSSGATLALRVNGVRLDDAVAIDRHWDGGGANASTTGMVRWGDPAANGLVQMDFVVPITGC